MPLNHLQVPDLKLSQEVLEYGSVQTGKAGVVTLQLHNNKQVPCEWSVKRPIEASKAKDWAFFVVEPPEGVLEPDQKINVKVIFTPVLGREAPYLQVRTPPVIHSISDHVDLSRSCGPCVEENDKLLKV